MTKQTFVLACVVALLSGCATPINQHAKYLQLQHPQSNQVVMQFSFENGEYCDAEMIVMKNNCARRGGQMCKQFTGQLSCNDVTASYQLPYIARIKASSLFDTTYFDIETMTESDCIGVVEGIRPDVGLEIDMTCKKK